jgi:chemotaxis protein methyltransferase CheR
MSVQRASRRKLETKAQKRRKALKGGGGLKDITEKEYHRIRDYIKVNFGINLGEEKRSLIYSRLHSVIVQKGFNNFTQYFDYLVADKSGAAVTQFIDKVTTNHTFFQRETDHFDYFRDTVLPQIEAKHKADRDVRVWCAGCSSGEESCQLEMILQDYFGGKPEKWDTQLLATDISTQVLEKAVAGVYPAESVSALPPKWRNEYFTKLDNERCAVSSKIKSQITYRKLNLMDDAFPFKKQMQAIFCRNVMIYFDNETRDSLVEKFYDLTEPGGYLFIGHSESLNNTSAKYKYIKPAIYRKQ